MEHEPLEARLQRLAREREAADRAYNDALTELDRAGIRAPAFPTPPAAYDEHQITPLNHAWEVLAPPPSRSGFKGRLAAFVWGLVAPTFQRQTAFNSLLVDHLNRNVAAHRDARPSIEATIAALQGHVDALLALQGRLLVFLQQITLYVDTKDRAAGGQALIVNAAVNALAGDVAMRRESAALAAARLNDRVDGLAAAHDELRALLGIVQQASLTIKRELERVTAASASGVAATPDRASDDTRPPGPSASSDAAFTSPLDSYKYVGFEDQFRGSRDTIRARLESYVPYFSGARDVLDVGCGRGEFLDLLKAAGISGRGLDLNHEMVEVCRARGLDVAEADVVTYLEGLPDASLGGLFAAQVVEHLQPAYLLRFLELAHHKLRPGAPMVLETLNPACWVAFFESFIRDITHVWPLHPETLRYLVLASGFTTARIELRSPVPPEDRLQPIAAAGAAADDLVETFNANVEKLNARMFTHLDYAIVGTNA